MGITLDKLVEFLVSERNFKQKPLIIGLTGHIGSGKTYIANRLSNILLDNGYEVRLAAIASPLKHLIQYFSYQLKTIEPSGDFVYITADDIRKMFKSNLDVVDYVEQLIRNSDNSKDWRYLAQTIGAEVRKVFGENVWIQLLIERLQTIETDFVFINDVRYLNEDKLLRKTFPDNYLLVRVNRDKELICKTLGIDLDTYEQKLQHESERDISKLPADFELLNNN